MLNIFKKKTAQKEVMKEIEDLVTAQEKAVKDLEKSVNELKRLLEKEGLI